MSPKVAMSFLLVIGKIYDDLNLIIILCDSLAIEGNEATMKAMMELAATQS